MDLRRMKVTMVVSPLLAPGLSPGSSKGLEEALDPNSLRTLDIYPQGSWLLNVLHSTVRGEAFTNNSGSINIDSTVQPCNPIK